MKSFKFYAGIIFVILIAIFLFLPFDSGYWEYGFAALAVFIIFWMIFKWFNKI